MPGSQDLLHPPPSPWNRGSAAPCRPLAEWSPAEGTWTQPTSEAFTHLGGLATLDRLAELLRGATPQTELLPRSQPMTQVVRWIASGTVVAFRGPDAWLLPLFQFDLPLGCVRPCVSPVLAELRGFLEDREIALWFVNPNVWLDGARPVLVMLRRLPSVLVAARADRYVACGA